MKFLLSILFALSLPVLGSASDSNYCELHIPCKLGDRSFHARVPDGWDGRTKLPVLLHFHGWGRQGPLIMKHGRIAGATRKLGVLLLAPNGSGRTWNFWNADSNDIQFANDVIEEASRRWPIDRSKIFVSGYSYGSAMAWRFACAEGRSLYALLAVSGSFPNQNEDCAHPLHVRHVHGVKDTVMDYPYGDDGTVESAVSLWRNLNKCQTEPDTRTPWQAVKILPFLRHTWQSCATGKSVVLDVHQRGHFIPRFWIERQLKELL